MHSSELDKVLSCSICMPIATPLVASIITSLVQQSPAKGMNDLVRIVVNKELHPDADLPKGVLIGLAAGILGTVAKTAVDHFFPVVKKEDANLQTIHLGDHALEVNVDTTEWVTGVLVGGAYGAAAEIAPEVTMGNGIGLGTAIYGLNNSIDSMTEGGISLNPKEENESHELLGELAYGVVVEFVRSALRARIR